MTIVRVLARPLLASSFIVSGVDRVRRAESTAAQLQPVLDTVTKAVPAAAAATANGKLVAQVLGATQIGAGLLLAMGKFSRPAAILLSASAAVNALADFKSADSSTPEARKERRNQLLKNLSLMGAVLLAAVDTNGRPGLAWRAEHFASDARKNAKVLRYDTRRSARQLAKDAEKNLKKADKAVRKTASDVVGA